MVERDPNDDKNVIVETRAGTGGDEAALFAGDLFKMLTRYADELGFSTEVLSQSPAEVGGFKEVTFAVKGDGAYSVFKYEGGTHRVQRVPKTESQGRIHTSTATVAVLPEAEDVEVDVDPGDLEIETFRSTGPGGQSVNTTDSAVRITHKPTGTVVSMQDEKSQLQNREKAMRVLRARLYERALAEQRAEIDSERRAQVGSGERSEKIRTYNYPQGRVTDHRVKHTSHDLDGVLAGDLREFTDVLTGEERRRRLEAQAAGRVDVAVATTPVREALAAAADGLGAAGVDSPRLDAELLLAEATGWTRAQHCGRSRARRSTPRTRASSRRWCAAACAASRVAYLTGRRGFPQPRDRRGPARAHPRPETELLVELALEREPASVLDVGTGSGAVALAIADELPRAEVVATDVSPGALEVARDNAARLGLAERVSFHEAAEAPERRYDLVVANLPYVREDEWATLEPEITEHEPRDALVAGRRRARRDPRPARLAARLRRDRARGRRRPGRRGRGSRRRGGLRAGREAPRPRRHRARRRRDAMSEAVSIERDGADEARAALERCVGRGGVALFPADTVYGLACDPLDAAAVAPHRRAQGAGARQALGGDVLRPAGDARADRGARAAHAPRARGASARPRDARRRQPARALPARLRGERPGPRAAADRRAARRRALRGAPDEREPHRRAAAASAGGRRRGPAVGRRPRDRRRRASGHRLDGARPLRDRLGRRVDGAARGTGAGGRRGAALG